MEKMTREQYAQRAPNEEGDRALGMEKRVSMLEVAMRILE